MTHSNVYPSVQPFPVLFSDEVTKDKIRRHLTDINDVISEDDIRNIKTDMGDEKISTGKEEKEDGNNSAEIDTVWNVVD
jgi:hypothetical protein